MPQLKKNAFVGDNLDDLLLVEKSWWAVEILIFLNESECGRLKPSLGLWDCKLGIGLRLVERFAEEIGFTEIELAIFSA